jgi:signal transduction histidine kinase
MTGFAPDAVIRGQVSPDGRLIAADGPLLDLQRDAGGTMDGPLVVPALAQLVRVAGRLGVTIARPVIVGGAERDVALWVRLKPGADGVDIAIIRQQEGSQARHDKVDFPAVAAHAEMAREGWSWQVDRQLQFRVVNSEDRPVDHVLPQIGAPLASYFRLMDSEPATPSIPSDPLPLLAGIAAARPFSGQRAVLRSDESIAYSLVGLPLFDGRGRLTGYRGKARLIRDEVTASAAEEQALDRPSYNPAFARKLDTALRQPLGRIVANANTISGQLEGPLRADYASYAADIAAAGQHLLGLVDDLADLQAIERPDFIAARERVDLADLSRRAAGLLNVRAAERHIAIEPPKAGESAAAIGEYRRVLQILVNLIGNAVRYSPDSSSVWVRVDEDSEAGTVSVVVADQGRGIDPADHERIFARFERLVPDDGTGSGLGLYISRLLARAMGGDITVESALGQGSRFTLTLPQFRG